MKIFKIMKNIETLIIVPARQGSEGLKDKNIRLLGNKPLLVWTAEAVKRADLNNCLSILSTDSEKYAAIGKKAELTVPFIRPPEISTGSSSSLQVVQHSLHWFEESYEYLPENIMLLQPTSPFRTSRTILDSIQLLKTHVAANAVIGCKVLYRDLTTLFKVRNQFLLPLSKEKNISANRQDTEALLTPNGAIYLIRTSALLKQATLLPERSIPLIMDDLASIDIDNEYDWSIAEALVEKKVIDYGV